MDSKNKKECRIGGSCGRGGKCQICPFAPLMLVLIILWLVFGGCGMEETKPAAEKPAPTQTETKMEKNVLIREKGTPEETARIISEVRAMPIGSVGPELMFANGKDVFIVHFRGILRYDLKERKIVDAIDNAMLNLHVLQGDDPVRMAGDNTYAIIKDSRRAYRYEMATGKLEEVPLGVAKSFPKVVDLPAPDMRLPEEYDINAAAAEDDLHADGIIADGRPIILTYRWNDDKGESWRLHWQDVEGKQAKEKSVEQVQHHASVFAGA